LTTLYRVRELRGGETNKSYSTGAVLLLAKTGWVKNGSLAKAGGLILKSELKVDGKFKRSSVKGNKDT